METDQVLLSIIIPTKDRYESLLPVIKAILNNVKSNDLQLVIHDNSNSNEQAIRSIYEINDHRLKYIYCDEVLSMSENTNKAIAYATGKYISFIGDDDFVSPYICEIVKMINDRGINSLIYSAGYYWWSNVIFKKIAKYRHPKTFWMPRSISFDLVKMNSQEQLGYVLERGGDHYYNLPRFYHGIVTRDILEKIKAKTGKYLVGSCPDMVFALSISKVIPSYYFINYPVTVFGATMNSGGGWSARKTHFGKIEEMSFLPVGIINNWDPRLPKIWSAISINAQSVFEVMKAFKSNEAINYARFYASMIATEPYLKTYILPSLNKSNKFSLLEKLSISIFALTKFFKLRVMHIYLLFLYNSNLFKYHVSDQEDVDLCMKVMKEINISAIK